MPTPLPPLRFTGATVLRDGTLQRGALGVAGGRIATGPLPEVDLSGCFLLPGIVDLHGAAVEQHVAQRPSAPSDPSTDLARGLATGLASGLASAGRDAAANGVTTGWLAQAWSWEGGLRGPDFAEALLAAHRAAPPRMGTDLRIKIRCETHMVEGPDRLLAAIRRHGVDYVVFGNHLDTALARARSAGGMSRDDRRLLDRTAARRPEVPRHLCRLAEAFDALGVSYGSHDDPDAETRERFSMIGARIAELPAARTAAKAAHAMNDPVLMGAPDVLHGGSRPGTVAAADLVAEGLCDALVSGGRYPALAAAAWALVDAGLRTLPEAWAMISTRPAAILGLGDRGTLAPGRRADLVAVNAATRAIEMTIAGGALTHLAGSAAARLAGAPARTGIAAE
jgi:alpha-D-ribose 1-methylphosphonate 5-triphosphate diphosphatase